MAGADYGLYGTRGSYAGLAAVGASSLALAVVFESLRLVSAAVFLLSVGSALFLVSMSLSRKTLVSAIVEVGSVRAGHRVLDVGTGRGFLAIEIAKAVAGCHVVGIDIWDMPAKGQMHKGFVTGNSKENAERNAILKGVSESVEFKQCDAREMSFESESFDAVVSSVALHQMVHFGKDGHRVLEQVHRVLKAGGRFVDADVMVGKPIVEQLQALGFEEIKVRSVGNLGRLHFLKLLSATKPT